MTVQAGIYCRISLAAMGDTTKVDDQERICRELAGRLGWEVADVYQDHAKSAWQPSRKRKEWDRMLADVERGRIAAIVVYHGDRLLRTHEDLLALIRLARLRGVQLASPAGTRDLGNYDDQFILEIEASMAKRESANTSRRRKAQYERWRREGRVRPGGRGGRAFGYESGDTAVREDEAAAIREACRRILAGESCGSVARDLTARGFTTAAGSPVTGATLTRTLARPRYAGLMPDGLAAASWPAILDRADWEMLVAVLAAKAAGFGYATNARRYLLSGIAECGVCGSRAHAHPSRGRKGQPAQVGYACRADGCRKVYRSVTHLDAYVTGYVVARLGRADNPAAEIDTASGAGAELAALTARRTEVEAVIASLASHPGQRIDVLARALTSFDEKIAAIREQMSGGSRAHLIEAHAGISREEFADLPLDVRRAIVQATCRVVILPGRKGPGFDPRDVILAPA